MKNGKIRERYGTKCSSSQQATLYPAEDIEVASGSEERTIIIIITIIFCCMKGEFKKLHLYSHFHVRKVLCTLIFFKSISEILGELS